MKRIKVFFCVGLVVLAMIPVVTFNLESPSVSEIDNRSLTEFDIYSQDKTEMIDSYIKDRIGLRTKAINAYTVINDKVFGEMVHPSYTYGKSGEVFFKASQENVDTEFVDAFCEYLKKIQTYCEERDVPFIYCLNPGKISVYSEYLPKGYNYQNKFIIYMEKKLKEYNINYINNYELMREKSQKERVWNQKYDAGHWNDLGAFYGINNILNKVSESFPKVRRNEKTDFEISETLEESLPVSYFEINEMVPLFENKNSKDIKDITEEFPGIEVDENHRIFFALENKKGNDLPNVLFFRGSYLNNRSKFVESRFGKTYGVHNYENLLNFEYYFNIFQPDCVILETAEYSTNGNFFNYEKMINKSFNDVLQSAEMEKAVPISEYDCEVKTEKRLTNIVLKAGDEYSGGYLINGEKVFDLLVDKETGTMQCTIDSQYYDESKLKVVMF